MNSVDSGLRRRPRHGFLLAALLGCGLLASACTEAPKIAKAPDQESTTAAQRPARAPEATPPEASPSEAPAPEAAAPAKPAEPPTAEAPDKDQPAAAGDSGGGAKKYHYSRREEQAPEAAPEAAPETEGSARDLPGAAAPSNEGAAAPSNQIEPAPSDDFRQGAGGGAAPPADSQPPPPPPSMGQGAPAPSAEPPPPVARDMPSEPSGGAAPPTDFQPPPPPPPPPSLGEGAPPPTPEPKSVEAAPPPPAPPPPAPSETVTESRSGGSAVKPPEAEITLPPPESAPVTSEEKARADIVNDPAKKYDVVPVFYGTDREIEPDPKRLQFGAERGHKLQLGRALITVPLSHKVPHLERPWLIEIPYFKVKVYEEQEDPNKHFTVQEIASLTEEQMLALVKERLAKSKNFKDHAFVFIHGFNTSFDCALYRTAQIAFDLKFDGVPFVYSWPSGGKVASYTYDHGSVEQAEPTLAEFLKLVVQKSGAKSISLIAHSMGNELLLRVLERLRPDVPKGVVISQVILAAPDVDRDKFNIIAREITNFAKGVTLYAASNDRALGYSARFWGGVPRAGDVPAVGGPLIIPGVDTIDVTAVSTDALGLNHSGYAENPALLDDVKALVEFGIRPPDKRIKNVLTVESAAGTFWRFPPAVP